MTRTSLGVVIFVGVLLRLALVGVNLEIAVLPQGGGDAGKFEREAWEFAEYGRLDLFTHLESGKGVITLLGSYVYDVTGRAPWALGLLMVALGAGVIWLAHRAALELWEDRRIAILVAWAAALFPQLALHSALFLREMPVSFCLAAAALCAVRYLKSARIGSVVWFSLWIMVGALFHSGVIIAIPALLIGTVLARPRAGRAALRFHLVNAVSVVLLVAVIYWANQTGFGLSKFGGSFGDAWQTFETQEMRATLGSAAYPEWMRLRGGVSDAWKVPVRLVTFLYSPLVPFMVRSPHHLLGALDAFLYLLLTWNLVRNWRVLGEGRRTVLVLIVVTFSLFLLFSLGVSNFGTAIRHRAKMAPLLLLLAAWRPERRRGSRSASFTAPPPRPAASLVASP